MRTDASRPENKIQDDPLNARPYESWDLIRLLSFGSLRSMPPGTASFSEDQDDPCHVHCCACRLLDPWEACLM